MRGLDPGIIYTVTINVFDGNQVIMSNQTEIRNSTVMSDQSGKSLCTYVHTYICTYVHMYICIIVAIEISCLFMLCYMILHTFMHM